LSVAPDQDNATLVLVTAPAVSVGAVGGVVSLLESVRVMSSMSGAQPEELENVTEFAPALRLTDDGKV
jgi:hypothetical protein